MRAKLLFQTINAVEMRTHGTRAGVSVCMYMCVGVEGEGVKMSVTGSSFFEDYSQPSKLTCQSTNQTFELW